MDSLTASAASGIRARLEALDLLANNLANAGTAGFKADREYYDLYLAAEAAPGENATELPVIGRNWTDFSAGALAATGNPADLALAGRGFFVIEGPSGPLYTRSGNFRISPSGRLETQDGYAVRMAGGKPLQLDPKAAFEVDREGNVHQQGRALGRIETVDFRATDALAKQGHTYFRLTSPAGAPAAVPAEVRQGALEAANVSPAETGVRMVTVLRQFEMLQKAVQISGEMNRRAVEEVARVS